MKEQLYAAGSYTTVLPHAPGGCGKGISILAQNTDTGELRLVQTLGGIDNPSWVHWDPSRQKLYSISESETGQGSVRAFGQDHGGVFYEQKECSGPGRASCHLLPLEDRDLLFTASYLDGSMTGFSLEKGLPVHKVCHFSYTGKGENQIRQEAPHAHQITLSPEGRYLFVCDLGSDKVRVHDLKLPGMDEISAFLTPSGYGPRHMVLDPERPVAYVLCELKAKLLCAEIREEGKFSLIDEYDTETADDSAKAAPAAVKIHPTGSTLYVSNRFTDTITVFEIDRRGGVIRLRTKSHFSCRGKTPRDFTFSPDGDFLLIANQDSNDIQICRIDCATGLPLDEWITPFALETAVCLTPLI
ncbi:MAG: lactonase family protein [Spirochaetales bacterium]|nr:lactonase family protein [Spirochaetales bacterium]